MTRWLGALALMLIAVGFAWAQLVPGQGMLVPRGGVTAVAPPASCTADGGTDWSNACDLGLLAAIGF